VSQKKTMHNADAVAWES